MQPDAQTKWLDGKNLSLNISDMSGYELLTLIYTGEVPGIIWGKIRASVLHEVNSIIERKAEGTFCL